MHAATTRIRLSLRPFSVMATFAVISIFRAWGSKSFYFNKLHLKLCSYSSLLKEMPKMFTFDLKTCLFLFVSELIGGK